MITEAHWSRLKDLCLGKEFINSVNQHWGEGVGYLKLGTWGSLQDL
jgi:hypothetical protein